MTLQQLKYLVTVAECKNITEAAEKLFISQPSLSASLHNLEEEMGVTAFVRSNKGVAVTREGEELLSYARNLLEQADIMKDRFCSDNNRKPKFSVSCQHYSFAVKAFVDMVKEFNMSEYEFAIRETKTAEVISDVSTTKSEIGLLYLCDFNRKSMEKLLKSANLEFHHLIDCQAYVYLWKGHPLANKEEISIEELEEYPCLAFEQGNYNSFYFAEEVLSTYEYKRLIRANDRATLLNLMVGLNAYTLCCGIICEGLNGEDYCAVKLKSNEHMTIGYLKRKGVALSPLGQKYLEEIRKYKAMGMDIRGVEDIKADQKQS